jgi:hypothetical protein
MKLFQKITGKLWSIGLAVTGHKPYYIVIYEEPKSYGNSRAIMHQCLLLSSAALWCFPAFANTGFSKLSFSIFGFFMLTSVVAWLNTIAFKSAYAHIMIMQVVGGFGGLSGVLLGWFSSHAFALANLWTDLAFAIVTLLIALVGWGEASCVDIQRFRSEVAKQGGFSKPRNGRISFRFRDGTYAFNTIDTPWLSRRLWFDILAAMITIMLLPLGNVIAFTSAEVVSEGKEAWAFVLSMTCVGVITRKSLSNTLANFRLVARLRYD